MVVANRSVTLFEFTLAQQYLQNNVVPNQYASWFKSASSIWYHAQYFPTGEIYIDRKQVIPVEHITTHLQKLWLNPKIGGVGVDRFYAKVSAQFFGITKQAVHTFMNNLEGYQLHKRVKRAETVNPILPVAAGIYYQIDLIDMSKYSWYNNGYSWILTCIDLFTKKAYATALKNKEALTIRTALNDWLNKLPNIPRVIQSDRGTEFINQAVKNLLSFKGIRQQLSLAHSPESQGAIERFNGTLKRILNLYFTTYQQPIWKDLLPLVVQNYNSSDHTSIGMPPSKAQYQERTVYSRLVAQARSKIQQAPKYPPLYIGDTVRLSLQTTTDYRKDTFRKKYLTQWSKELYRVTAIIPATALSSDKYAIVNMQGQTTGRRYFRYQLQKINPDELITNTTIRPNFESGFFNRVQHLQTIHPSGPSRRSKPKKINKPITRSQQKETDRQANIQAKAKAAGVQNFVITIPAIPKTLLK